VHRIKIKSTFQDGKNRSDLSHVNEQLCYYTSPHRGLSSPKTDINVLKLSYRMLC